MFRVQEFYDSGTDAAAGAAAGAAATAAASAAATVATTVKTVVKTKAAAEAAAVAAAVAAAPAAASVSEEKNSWTLNIIRFLVFVTLFLHGGVGLQFIRYNTVNSSRTPLSNLGYGTVCGHGVASVDAAMRRRRDAASPRRCRSVKINFQRFHMDKMNWRLK